MGKRRVPIPGQESTSATTCAVPPKPTCRKPAPSARRKVAGPASRVAGPFEEPRRRRLSEKPRSVDQMPAAKRGHPAATPADPPRSARQGTHAVPETPATDRQERFSFELAPAFPAEERAHWLRFRHGPEWRWQLAQHLAGRRPHRYRSDYDRWVQMACDFARAENREDPGREAKFPEVVAAQGLAAPGPRRDALKLLVMGGTPTWKIARRFSLPGSAIAAWEALFFDIRPVLSARDWILTRVITPEAQRGDSHLAVRLQFAAAGPVAAAAVVDAESRISLVEGQHLFDRKVRLLLKFAAAEQLVVDTPRTARFFLKLYSALRIQERKLDLAERRLEERCQRALERTWQLQKRREAEDARVWAKREQAAQRQRAPGEGRRRHAQEAGRRAAHSALQQLQWCCKEKTVPPEGGGPH